MKTILTCSEMKESDRHTIEEIGVPSSVLMERAALACAGKAVEKWDGRSTVLAVCGSGNNGGDGIAAARILFLKNIPSQILFAGDPDHMTDETKRQMMIAQKTGVPVTYFRENEQEAELLLSKDPMILDALFGIGLSRPVEGVYNVLIERMNQSRGIKIAVDIPSGVNGDTGNIMGCAFHADCTVTFAFLKRGLCVYPGKAFAGETFVADIGIVRNDPEKNAENTSVRMTEISDLHILKKRDPGGNKGSFGKVLVIAGSSEICGAAYFAAAAALRCGAGMVMIHTAPENRGPLQILLPEALISCSDSEEERRRIYEWCDVVAAGPGIGTGNIAKENILWFMKKCHEDDKPLVLDADALNLLSMNPHWKAWLGENTVLTPHLAEMSRLCGATVGELKEDLLSAAFSYSRENHCILILKDAATVIAYPDGTGFINGTGNDGMATAGSGDVLTGIVAAFLLKDGAYAQDAVCFHGICGDIAAEKLGRASVTAGTVIESVPAAFLRIFKEGEF